MAESVYITALGKFLPGPSVSNEEVETYMGMIGGKPSGLRSRILKQNGILGRHYAIDREGRVNYWNCDLAARAALDAISRSELTLAEIEMLAAATTQSDLLAPGFASMTHGRLQAQPCEIASLSGVCASGVTALNYAR